METTKCLYDTAITMHPCSLTHKDRDIKETILRNKCSNWFFLNETWYNVIRILPKSVPDGPFKNVPALLTIRIWRRSCGNPLSQATIDRWYCHVYASTPLDVLTMHKHIETRPKWQPVRKRHFHMHFSNENVWISKKIALKFVHKDPFNNILTLIQTRKYPIIWTNDD